MLLITILRVSSLEHCFASLYSACWALIRIRVCSFSDPKFLLHLFSNWTVTYMLRVLIFLRCRYRPIVCLTSTASLSVAVPVRLSARSALAQASESRWDARDHKSMERRRKFPVCYARTTLRIEFSAADHVERILNPVPQQHVPCRSENS